MNFQDVSEQEPFVMRRCFNIYADVSLSFWADILIMKEGILWNNLFHFNVNEQERV